MRGSLRDGGICRAFVSAVARRGRQWLVVALGMATALSAAWGPAPEARTHQAGRVDVPAMIRKVLPAAVSITPRQIERDQFNQPVPTRGLGSGVIVDPLGYILTNSQVAVIRIDGKSLPVARLGDSARLAVGETIVAIGNPLWIEGGPTVTVGVVSALGRSMEQPGLPMLHNLVQTDAAINTGNSGGPLVSLAGRMVGINTAIIASAHGIGFAISVNSAKPVLAELIASGRVVRSFAGLEAVSVTPQVAYANDLPMERGALVIRVDPGGPAAAAGVEPGDVITAVDGRAVRDLHYFHDAVARRRAGETVSVTLARDGQILTLGLVLEEDRRKRVLSSFASGPFWRPALLPSGAASAGPDEVITRAESVEPGVLRTVTGRRVEFVARVNAPVHVEFGDDPSQHQVYQMPAAGPIWVIFHRPGTHPYTVHTYEAKTTTALPGSVEVVEDPARPWGPGTCGAVVMGDCIEP